MSYTFETHLDSPNFWHGRQGRSIDWIVIHWWGDPNTRPSHDGVVAHLMNPQSEVSAHYVASAGRVTCLVDPNDTAWHAMSANQSTIGIECSPYMTDWDFETVAELVANIWDAYGREIPLAPHKKFVATACPGVWEARLGELTERARAIRNSAAGTPAPAPVAPVVDVDELARAVIRGEYGNGEARRTRLGANYEAVQERVNQLLGQPTPTDSAPAFDVYAAAQAVIRGEYGNGEERRQALGAHYQEVQALVNKILLG